MNRATQKGTPATGIYRLHPKIALESCAYCHGRGFVPTFGPNRTIGTAPCWLCAGRGTIVVEAAA